MSGVLAACSLPSTTREDGKPAPRAVAPDPEPPACRDSTAVEVWARFGGELCDWELHDDDEHLRLSSLALTASAPARGEVPPPCRDRTCVYHGAATVVGPLVLAVVPSTESEMPSDVLLGIVHDEQLVFASLWDGAGEPVELDLTHVGPAHALAPFVCGDALALLAVRRIDAAGVVVPETLRAREGRLHRLESGAELESSAADTGAAASADPWASWALWEPLDPETREHCRAIDLPVP